MQNKSGMNYEKIESNLVSLKTLTHSVNGSVDQCYLLYQQVWEGINREIGVKKKQYHIVTHFAHED